MNSGNTWLFYYVRVLHVFLHGATRSDWIVHSRWSPPPSTYRSFPVITTQQSSTAFASVSERYKQNEQYLLSGRLINVMCELQPYCSVSGCQYFSVWETKNIRKTNRTVIFKDRLWNFLNNSLMNMNKYLL